MERQGKTKGDANATMNQIAGKLLPSSQILGNGKTNLHVVHGVSELLQLMCRA